MGKNSTTYSQGKGRSSKIKSSSGSMKFTQAPSDLHDDTTKPMKLLDDHEPRTHVRQFAQCPAAGHCIAQGENDYVGSNKDSRYPLKRWFF